MKKFLMVSLALLLIACNTIQPTPAATPTPYPTPVRPTFTVQRGAIVIDAVLVGRVAPLALHIAYFSMTGHVSNVYAQVGDTVTEGQVLADLVELNELQTQTDTMRRAIRRAQIALEIAQLTLEKSTTEARPTYELQIQQLQVELAQMNLDETLESLGLDPDLAALDALEAQVAQAKLFAPAAGVIIAAVTPGRGVNATFAAFTIGDKNKLEIIAAPEATAQAIAQLKEMFEGMPVTVAPEGRDVLLTGVIRQLPSPYGTSPDDNIHILLNETPSATTYQAGDKVTITIRLANKTDILWLSPEAIRQAGGRTFVLIDGDAGPKRVDIEIGLQTTERVEILAGLQDGQVVIGP